MPHSRRHRADRCARLLVVVCLRLVRLKQSASQSVRRAEKENDVSARTTLNLGKVCVVLFSSVLFCVLCCAGSAAAAAAMHWLARHLLAHTHTHARTPKVWAARLKL